MLNFYLWQTSDFNGLSTLLHKIVSFLNAEGCIAIAEGCIAIAKGCIAIAEGRIAIAEGRIAIAEGRIAIAEGRIAIAEGRIAIAEGRIAIAKFTAEFKYLNHICCRGARPCAPTAWSIYLKIAVIS
ncbi:hypothetical protein [Nostoc sp. 'Lobaria pulmonaria (5183) cyanobiont']|uniref:hypothetical protein n=1 Tax=Nostoc sp. 'Lobaria pulmonaria (5183) cyanobiont' TaxID=1618022 RepID=UPI000CF301EC|nr:hypothetical protein [Nostoc sp. 'Lobaria pulmonaria (5183) cyanobiont']